MNSWEVIGRMITLNVLRGKRLREHTSGCGLYDGQLPVLECLIASPGCTQHQLACRLMVSPASIAQSTKRLQRAGLIEKRVDEDNLRCNRLYATKSGTTLAVEYRRSFDLLNAEMLRGLSEADLLQFADLLGRMIANLNGGTIPSMPPWRECKHPMEGENA